jgi:hypothetical protein
MDKSLTVDTFQPSLAVSQPKRISLRGTTSFEWMFIILGGLPLYLPFIFYMGERGLSTSDPIYWYFWINAAVSSPHVYSTYARLGRKIHEGRVSKWFGFPLYVAIFGALVLASRAGYFLEAMTAVNLWQSLHYCRQVFGVSKLMSRNAPKDERATQLAFYGYHLVIPLFVLGRWDVLYTVWSGKPSSTIIPVDISSWIMGICWALAGAGIVAGLGSEARIYRQTEGEYNPSRLVTFIVYYAIHMFGFLSVSYFQRGFFAVTIFHAVQYLGIVWLLEHKASKGRSGDVYRRLPVGAGFALFWLFFFVAGYGLENYVFMGANTWWPLLASIGLAAVSAHHYSVDTVMWRRKVGA